MRAIKIIGHDVKHLYIHFEATPKISDCRDTFLIPETHKHFPLQTLWDAPICNDTTRPFLKALNDIIADELGLL